MSKIRISAVSYLNTIPFIYGLEKSGIQKTIAVERDVPAICAQKLLNNEADIGLIPVAALLNMNEYHILGDYCIGASSPVRTVALMSNDDIADIQSIYLDPQSRSSNNLARMLAHEYWNISPKWVNTQLIPQQLENNTAAVFIGDKVFKEEKKYSHRFDLAETWMNYTGKAFVFAAWISNKKLDPAFKKEFNNALAFGLENIRPAIAEFSKPYPLTEKEIFVYLTKNIDFHLDKSKRESMKMFLDWVKAHPLPPG